MDELFSRDKSRILSPKKLHKGGKLVSNQTQLSSDPSSAAIGCENLGEYFNFYDLLFFSSSEKG